MVGFNYRRVPAIAARRLIDQGRLGKLRHVRAAYLQDWLVDPSFPLTWRLDASQAGSGALGDLATQAVLDAATRSARSRTWIAIEEASQAKEQK